MIAQPLKVKFLITRHDLRHNKSRKFAYLKDALHHEGLDTEMRGDLRVSLNN